MYTGTRAGQAGPRTVPVHEGDPGNEGALDDQVGTKRTRPGDSDGSGYNDTKGRARLHDTPENSAAKTR